MNINKVRRVLKAENGLQTPPYWNGITRTYTTQDNNKKKGLSINGVQTMSTVGNIADTARGLFFNNVNNSTLTNGLNNAYDAVSNSLMGFSPVGTVIGGAMKVGAFVGDALSFMGVGTDQMTTTDKILDSNFMKISPIGLVNALGGKRTQQFSMDTDTIEDVGGSYMGSVKTIGNAVDKAGKKYGLFSSGARRRANNQINEARTQQNTMARIADDAEDRNAMVSDLGHIKYGFDINGGYDQRYIRAAKFGATLKRVKKIDFHKRGGEIKDPIDLWEPVIIDPEPESFQSGGKTKPTFESWYKTVPEDRNDTTSYNLKRAFELAPFDELERWRTATPEQLKTDNSYHLRTFYMNPETGIGEFVKSKDHPTIKDELDFYYSDEGADFRNKYDLDTTGDYYKYVPKKFESGGNLPKEIKEEETKEETTQKNVIPEGALHAHKHHMENSGGLTQKGIPVVDIEGMQQAEIERNEVILTLELTKKLEDLYSKYTDYEYSQKEKDEVAIEAGKILVYELLQNTEDRTGLIKECKKGGVLNESK